MAKEKSSEQQRLERRRYSLWVAVWLEVLLVHRVPLAFSQQTTQTTTISAVAVVNGGTNVPFVNNITVQALPGAAFFGKDVVIPVEVTGPASPIDVANLKVSMVYQLFDSAGSPKSEQPVMVPITFQVEPTNPYSALGAAIISAQNLLSVQRGWYMNYYFQAQSGNQTTTLKSPSAPFQVQFVNNMSFPVSPSGSDWKVPDTFIPDGKTEVSFSPGALSSPGTLGVTRLDPLSVPTGPGGLLPVVVYQFDLQGTSLLTQAQLTLTYAANPDGSLEGFNGNPLDLAPYTLQGLNWQVLGPRQVDTTKHTVSVTTTHFSTFALFLTGATGAADIRPMQRVLTPNGDGINDTVSFAGADSVKIFDIRGRRVRSLSGPAAVWDGRDDDGHIVESGIYIYQYNSQGQRVSGVILVAK